MTVAKVLQDNIRRFDIAARIGGDEFAILLDDMAEPDVVSKIAALKETVEAHPLHFGDDEMRPQISLGYAMVDADEDAEALLAKADAHMYAQKHAGKGGSD